MRCTLSGFAAAAADASVRTFGNYFSGNYEAICALATDRARRIAAEPLARPADEPLWSALASAVLAHYEFSVAAATQVTVATQVAVRRSRRRSRSAGRGRGAGRGPQVVRGRPAGAVPLRPLLRQALDQLASACWSRFLTERTGVRACSSPTARVHGVQAFAGDQHAGAGGTTHAPVSPQLRRCRNNAHRTTLSAAFADGRTYILALVPPDMLLCS
jgi:hypothetical protein